MVLDEMLDALWEQGPQGIARFEESLDQRQHVGVNRQLLEDRRPRHEVVQALRCEALCPVAPGLDPELCELVAHLIAQSIVECRFERPLDDRVANVVDPGQVLLDQRVLHLSEPRRRHTGGES